MIYLNKNENLYGPAPKCFQTLSDVTSEDFSCYTRHPVGEIPVLLGDLYGLPHDQILVTHGNEDLLRILFAYYVFPQDVVLLPSHSWWYYQALGSQRNARLHYYSFCEREQSFCADFEGLLELESALTPRLTVICSPNNPTGNPFDLGHLETLLQKNHDRLVFYDETYWGFADSDSTGKLVQLLQRHDNLVVGRSFSKYYALAGLRAGFALMGKNVKKTLHWYDRILGVSSLLEKVVLAALESGEYYDRVARVIVRDRELLFRGLNVLPEVCAYTSQANFLFVRFPVHWVQELDSRFSGEGFEVKFFSEEVFQGCSRISIGKTEYVEEVLRIVQEYAGQVASRSL